jgi:dolichyl-phosphate-mannose--protein O-mannosyl transferase
VFLLAPNPVLGVMRVLYATTVALWLITPVVAFNSVLTLKARSILLSFFLVAFSVAVAITAKARKYDVLIAVATYVPYLSTAL